MKNLVDRGLDLSLDRVLACCVLEDDVSSLSFVRVGVHSWCIFCIIESILLLPGIEIPLVCLRKVRMSGPS